MPTRKAKYPGRSIVLSRSDARQRLYRDAIGSPIAPWCTAPVEVPAIGLPGYAEARQGDTKPAPFTMRVACRRCAGCLKHRSNLWAARAISEIQMSKRTWFCTLTLRPEERFRLSMRAEKRFLRASRETLADASPQDRYRYIWAEVSTEVTKYLKRVRKQAGPFRYLLVAEKHKDGFPHVHLLIHERGDPITKSVIQAQWAAGFSQCKLVDYGPRPAFYVAKYLAKEASARVRSSQRYGQGLETFLTEQISEICDAVRSNGQNGTS